MHLVSIWVSSILKTSHVRNTKYWVETQDARVIDLGNLEKEDNIISFDERYLLIRRRIPCKKPQITKFQEAPCHSPPRSIVIISANAIVRVPFLLPPKGMYR